MGGMNNRGTNIKSVSSWDAASCCNECRKVAECTGYTLVKDTGACWLKSNDESPVYDVSTISGSVGGLQSPSPSPAGSCGAPQEGMNNRGTNIKSVSSSDAASCCNECLRVAECTGYTLVKDTGACWLKSNVESPVYDASTISGSVSRQQVVVR